ncbi:MAG TPA: hypothetical protein VGF40_19785 [Thermoanaerobaculia bacterium]
MSKRINVNPDHYKVAGRERPGEDIVATEHKQKFGNVHRELTMRAEQRNRSLESMRAQPAREESSGRTAQARGRKKTAKAPPRSKESDEGDGGGAPRRRLAVPAEVRRIAASGATTVAALPATRIVTRKAKKTARKTKRAAVAVGSSAAAGAKNVVARAKKAVTRRPKQALPKKRGGSVSGGATSRPAGRSSARRASRKK